MSKIYRYKVIKYMILGILIYTQVIETGLNQISAAVSNCIYRDVYINYKI